MKQTLAAAVLGGMFALGASAATGESVSQLAAGGLVVLNSHYDETKGVVIFLMGDVQGAPLYVCQTRYRVAEDDDFDQCRKLR